MKTHMKLGIILAAIFLASAASVLAQETSQPVFVHQLIKCHEAKFDFGDAVGELNLYLSKNIVYAMSGYVNTGVPPHSSQSPGENRRDPGPVSCLRPDFYSKPGGRPLGLCDTEQ